MYSCITKYLFCHLTQFWQWFVCLSVCLFVYLSVIKISKGNGQILMKLSKMTGRKKKKWFIFMSDPTNHVDPGMFQDIVFIILEIFFYHLGDRACHYSICPHDVRVGQECTTSWNPIYWSRARIIRNTPRAVLSFVQCLCRLHRCDMILWLWWQTKNTFPLKWKMKLIQSYLLKSTLTVHEMCGFLHNHVTMCNSSDGSVYWFSNQRRVAPRLRINLLLSRC